MREACAATLYGLDAVYRHDDPFDATLLAVCTWAASLGPDRTASIDIFTGTDYLTLAGHRQPRPVLDEIHAVIAAHPQQRFHASSPPAPAADGADRRSSGPEGWAGATLFSSYGAVLGCLSVWSGDPTTPHASTPDLLPILARATMQTLEERRRVWSSRAVPAPGPRAVTSRRAARPTAHVDPPSQLGD